MGYFSNHAIDLQDRPLREDWSYFGPDLQLRARLDDLVTRFHELNTMGGQYDDRSRLSKEELRYVLPEHMFTLSDVAAAIEIAKDALLSKYGIEVSEEQLPTYRGALRVVPKLYHSSRDQFEAA